MICIAIAAVVGYWVTLHVWTITEADVPIWASAFFLWAWLLTLGMWVVEHQ